MGGIEERLRKYRLIGLDTMCFIYHFEENEEFFPCTRVLFELIEQGEILAVTSMITLIEVLTGAKKAKREDLIERYRYDLLYFPHLKVSFIDSAVADIASDLRVRYRIRTPDAIQIAAAINERANIFISNDESLKKIEEIKVLGIKEM